MPEAPRRLKIAVLSRVFSPTGGGAERYSIALVEQLAQRHEVHVFAQSCDHQWPGVTYHTVSVPLHRPRWINQLWYAANTWWRTRKGFDVVHSHENTWHGQVQTAHVLPIKYNLFHGYAGARLLMRYLKVASSPRLMAYLWLERARFAPQRHRCIIATSETLLKQITQTYPATAALAQVITPGVALACGAATATAQRAARHKLGLPDLGCGLLFVGNDYRKKGLETLIKALAQLPDDVWLAVVGQASQRVEFQAQAKAAGVSNRVIFLGPLKDVNQAYQAANCLVHPTLEDTFAMVVLEAMAHGLPVVLSSARYCGIASLLTDGVNALILENPRDAKVLAETLLRVLQEPALHPIGQSGTELARLHQWPVVARQQESIYFSVLGSTQCDH